MGIGMIMITDPELAEHVTTQGEDAMIIGEIRASSEEQSRVHLSGLYSE
jgi:phosphoribosylaminoimidazole (AIR) synthetase